MYDNTWVIIRTLSRLAKGFIVGTILCYLLACLLSGQPDPGLWSNLFMTTVFVAGTLASFWIGLAYMDQDYDR